MGYSFTWILNHLSQSYQVASASWAAYAVSASYVPLLAGPNITINYQANGIAITGSAGGPGGTPGGLNTQVQFNSGSEFSGSSNFTFAYTSNNLYLTGTFYVSGGISASYGANTVGFIGTSSWAQSSSWAYTSSQALTSSFITASGVYGPYGSSSVLSASWTSTASTIAGPSSLPPGIYDITASWAITSSYALVAETLVDNIWVRSTGDNSAVINDDSAHISIADGQSGVAYGDMTYTFGDYASSQGKNTEAIGIYTHAEGVSTYAIGEGSHTEGYNTRTGVEGEPYYLEFSYITASNFRTSTQWSASIAPTAYRQIEFNRTPALTIEDPNSSMYGLTFLFLFESGSVSGSNLRYESSSVAIYNSITKELLAHNDLSSFQSDPYMDGHLPRSVAVFSQNVPYVMEAWHERHTDTVKVLYAYYGNGFSPFIGMVSCSYDGGSLSSLYIHNTASYHGSISTANNINNNWTGSIATDTRWTGSAPSVQFNGSVQRTYYPAPGNNTYGRFFNATYNPYNNKTYALGTFDYLGANPSGIYIFNSDFQLEYTGSVGATGNTGIGPGGTLSYMIHGGTGYQSAAVTDIGLRSVLSGSTFAFQKPAIDKNGKIWYAMLTTTAGSPVHLFALKSTGAVSSSNANLFAHTIDHQNMGISASGASGPYYYPGDGTANSERIFVYVNYPYGSGSQGANYKKWLGYDINGVLRDNPWGNASTPAPVNNGYDVGLYWWSKEKVFLIRNSNTIYILNKDGSILGSTVASRPGSLNFSDAPYMFIQEVSENRTLVVEGLFDINASGIDNNQTSSIFWIDKLITSASVGQYSHAEGVGSAAGGLGSHAEGYYTIATGSYAHAEGVNTRALSSGSHAEGFATTASANYSHTEGYETITRGLASHAQGSASIAFGTASFAGGLHTIASGSYQTTIGQYNLRNNTSDLFVIGDGTSDANRHDLLNASGSSVRISGSLIVSNSLQLVGNGSITGSLRVSGSLTAIGSMTVSGSFIDTGSFNFIGNGNISGSLIVSNSLNVIGNQNISGSLTVSGSSNYIGNINYTGSLIVSNSLTVIGTNTTTGSVYITGSSTLVGNSTITGSILMTGSGYISKVEYIDFAITGSETYPAHEEGRVHWIDDAKTLEIDTEISNFMVEIGHQTVARVYNPESYTMTPGMVVRISGSQGNRPAITTASYEGDPTSANTLGFVATTISSAGNGYVVTNGYLRNVNTNAYTVGTSLYLSSSGQFTNIAPDAPLHEVRLGKVIVQNATTGVIYVNVMNGYELDELHDVKATNPSNGDLLIYSSSLWTASKQLTGSYGLTGSLLISGTLAVSSSNANQTQPAMQVNSEGVLGIGEFTTTPTAIVGALMYSGSDYYLGFP